MMNTKYFPQANDTGKEILDHYKDGKAGCLITAQCQSGKTGAVVNAMERISQEEKKKGSRAAFLYIGPSSVTLREQAEGRIKEVPEVYLNLVGSQTYHAPNILESRNSRTKIDEQLKMHMEQGHKVVVVLDEAHIGIGKSRVDLQAVPKFFRDALSALPYLSKNDNIFIILVTATPFTFDHFTNTNNSYITSGYPEVYMPPGNSYYGVKSAFDKGNLRQSFNPAAYRNNKRQRDEDFKRHLKEILASRQQEVEAGYFIFRATQGGNRAIIKEVCDELKIPFQTYAQKESNIREFADELEKTPGELRVMAIIRSYGAGKSLCRRNIVGWYEVNTYRNRHHADEYQSIGRNFGYNDPATDWPSYPVYCHMENMYNMVTYFEKCEEGDFEAKRKIQCAATHTKIQRRRVISTSLLIANTSEDCYAQYRKIRPHHQAGKFVSTCTRSNSLDVANTVNGKKIRRKIDGRINVLHLNNPHPSFLRSWNKIPKELHGKYVIVYEDDAPTEQDLRKDKSYLTLAS
jgi:hypothetical protein